MTKKLQILCDDKVIAEMPRNTSESINTEYDQLFPNEFILKLDKDISEYTDADFQVGMFVEMDARMCMVADIISRKEFLMCYV